MRVLSLVPIIAGLLVTAEAHTTVYGVWINGVRNGGLSIIFFKCPADKDIGIQRRWT